VTRSKQQRCFLPKHKILRGERTIERVFREGTFVRGKWFDVVYLCHEDLGEFTLAFAATRRARHAVERNRIKRRLREAFRLEQIALRPHCCALAIGNTKILRAGFPEVRAEMKRVFAQAGLLEAGAEG